MINTDELQGHIDHYMSATRLERSEKDFVKSTPTDNISLKAMAHLFDHFMDQLVAAQDGMRKGG